MAGRINRCSHCGCDEPIHNAIDGKIYCNNCGMRLDNSSVTNLNKNEKNSTPKGRIERTIKGVFERDFNDFSTRQLGEIASIIMDCDECPIFNGQCTRQRERCSDFFEKVLKEEMRRINQESQEG